MRAAIYVRVSTEDQARYGYSLAEQKQACREKAMELGAVNVIEFSDEGMSGSILDRPGLTALRDSVKNEKFKIIIVREPDRLSRKLSHQLIITEEFEKAGANLEFVDFEWKDNPEGRLFYSIRGAIAEYEREKIRDRMVRGKDQKARQGGIPVNFNLYGYNYNPETGLVSLNNDESVVVQNIFNWLISEDIGMNGIARRLNNNNTPTRKGIGIWHRNVVRQILTRTAYKGTWKYKSYEIPVPPIVTQETWEKAQRKTNNARRLYAGQNKNNYLLSGLISCSDCGNTMTGVYATWWYRKQRHYTCRKNSQGALSKGCHPTKYIPGQTIEDNVWLQVCDWLNDPDEIVNQLLDEEPSRDLEMELERVDKLLKHVEKGRERVLDIISLGLFECDAKTKTKLADLKQRKEKLEDRKKEIEAFLRNSINDSETNKLREYAQQILSNIDLLDFSEKKALVRAVVSQVSISGFCKRGLGMKNVQIMIAANLIKNNHVRDVNILR